MGRVRLGEVALERREIYKGSKDGCYFVGLEHLVPGNINLSMWDESGVNTFTKFFHKGDVLFGRRRAYLKKAVIAPFDGICSGDITVIVARPEYILPELLPFVVQNDAFFDFAVGKSAGSLSPRVKWEYLREFEFDLPEIDEQRKLARVLWVVNDTIEAYRRLMGATDELVRGQFVEMFGNPLKNEKCWPSKKMQEVAHSSSYDGKIDSRDNNFWLLNLDMIEPNTGRIIKKVYVPKEEIGHSTFTFSSDFVLYSKLRPYLNKVVIPDGTGYATTELIPLMPEPELLNQIYLASLLRSHEFVSFISSKVAGTKMPRVIMDIFRNFEVMLPPLDLQQQFADFVHQADKSKSSLQRALTAAKNISRKIISDNLR